MRAVKKYRNGGPGPGKGLGETGGQPSFDAGAFYDRMLRKAERLEEKAKRLKKKSEMADESKIQEGYPQGRRSERLGERAEKTMGRARKAWGKAQDALASDLGKEVGEALKSLSDAPIDVRNSKKIKDIESRLKGLK